MSTFPIIRSKPASCSGCPIEGHGTDFSQPEGTGSLGVMAIGEASGEWEQRDCLPFRPWAPAGSVLQRVIKLAGFDRQQLLISNIVRCRPKHDWLENAPYEYAAIQHCKSNLERLIAERKPKVLWALGGVALRELTGHAGKNRTITALQGYVLPGLLGIPVVGSVHPSYINRGASEMYKTAAEQLRVAVNVARSGFTPKPVSYITHPSVDEALSFEQRVRDNPQLLLTYDIETPNSTDLLEDERDDDPSYEIRSIQFSLGPYSGIFFPHRDSYIDIAKRILACGNRKAGWNNRGYDDPRLRYNGYTFGGCIEDFMHKWHSLQPDLPQNLQFAGSFLGMDFPWKHLNGSDPEFYGCADVDAPQRADGLLTTALASFGITESYERYVRDFYEPVLEPMSRRGIPVNKEKLTDLGTYLDACKKETKGKIQEKAPLEIRKMEPKVGYAGIPPRVKELQGRGFTYDQISTTPFTDPPKEGQTEGETFYFVRKVFDKPRTVETADTIVREDLLVPATVTEYVPEERWIKRYEFNPGAWQQIIRYMEFKNHPVPKKHKETNADGSKKDTTEAKELERLFVKTGDFMYKWVPEYRSFDKMKGTYVDGFAPGRDGRVHSTFTYAPAQWQLSSRNPNSQNLPQHVGLAEKLLTCFEAPQGFKWVALDFKSFHPLMLSFESRDEQYMRLVRMDVHSFLTAHFIKLPERDRLISYADDELRDRLAWVKKNHKHTRDYKCKRVVCGWGNGQGYKLCFAQWREYFESEGETKRLFQLLEALFPKTTKRKIEMTYEASPYPEHGGRPYLISRYKAIRWFWETYRWDPKRRGLAPGADFNKAQAFYGPNDAFGHMRDVMWGIQERGWDDRYQMVNNVHDALYFLPPDNLVEECIHQCREIAQAPNLKLVDPIIAPDGVWVEVGVKVGGNLADKHEGNPMGMEELKLPRPPYPLYGALNPLAMSTTVQ